MSRPQSWFSVVILVGVSPFAASCRSTAPAPAASGGPSVPVGTVGSEATAVPPASTGVTTTGGSAAGVPSRVVVQLTEEGFVPNHIPAEVGKPITLVITRKTEKTCAHEILFKGQPGKTDLPLDKEVTVSYTPQASGKVPFGCAMGMMVGGELQVR